MPTCRALVVDRAISILDGNHATPLLGEFSPLVTPRYLYNLMRDLQVNEVVYGMTSCVDLTMYHSHFSYMQHTTRNFPASKRLSILLSPILWVSRSSAHVRQGCCRSSRAVLQVTVG
jgi:hypothetical protein